MSDEQSNIGYKNVKCQLNISPNCLKKNAGYSRRPRFAQAGPWLDACENCAKIPYEQPEQFQKEEKTK